MSLITSSYTNCFISFKSSISHIPLPERFTFPFNYTPHPLCQIAAKELQHYLLTQTTWNHDFGIDQPIEGTNIGKMFGVLVVKTANGDLGYLAAFSGKVGGKNNHAHFVPPIVDMLHEGSFWRIGEDEISAINHQITALENLSDFFQIKEQFNSSLKTSERELEQYRRDMKLAKNQREAIRQEAATTLSPEDFELLKEKLKNESLKWQYDYKQLAKRWKEQIENESQELGRYTSHIEQLKEERKTKSAALQQRLFDQYTFLNKYGESKSVCDIFAQTDKLIPPAGAGDCAAPKLLQYAFTHQLQPIAMAEFWWGQSPSSEIRQHGHFYPSCKSKCEPILGYMLQDIPMDLNPVLLPPPSGEEPEIIYEDNDIGVLVKPAEYLSIPGKTSAPSVLTFIQKRCPDATGPIIVHRLDMSTSGLMVFAKNIDAYHSLQRQFLNRVVKKRYIALLDGCVIENEGVINLPLRPDFEDRPRQLVCFEYGKPATTKWQVISRTETTTRIQFEPITGRTHQLRVHSAHQQGLNCPIVGDDLYGKRANRLHLHAQSLEFEHPRTHETLIFQSDPNF